MQHIEPDEQVSRRLNRTTSFTVNLFISITVQEALCALANC